MRIDVDPALVGDRSEMSAEEFHALVFGGQPIAPVAPIIPDWQTSESAFMAKVDAYAKEHGWLTYHTWKSANSAPGFPDLICVRDDRLEAIELKVGRNQPTREQRRWLFAFNAIGGNVSAHLWYPEDIDEIEEVLR